MNNSEKNKPAQQTTSKLNQSLNLKAYYQDSIWNVLVINTVVPSGFVGMDRLTNTDPLGNNTYKQLVVPFEDVIILYPTGIKDINNKELYEYQQVKLKVNEEFQGSLESFRWDKINDNPDCIYTIIRNKGLWIAIDDKEDYSLLFDSWALEIEGLDSYNFSIKKD